MKRGKDKIMHYHSHLQPIRAHGDVVLQTVSSGPETPLEKIKMGYLRLINAAQGHTWIQTPYLVSDGSILNMLKVTVHSGVDIRVMIPSMPDYAFMYRATQYYAREPANHGVIIYCYQKGFFHTKTMMVDGWVISVESANLDFRSLKLSFEINVFIYNQNTVDDLERTFVNDIRNCWVITSIVFVE